MIELLESKLQEGMAVQEYTSLAELKEEIALVDNFDLRSNARVERLMEACFTLHQLRYAQNVGNIELLRRVAERAVELGLDQDPKLVEELDRADEAISENETTNKILNGIHRLQEGVDAAVSPKEMGGGWEDEVRESTVRQVRAELEAVVDKYQALGLYPATLLLLLRLLLYACEDNRMALAHDISEPLKKLLCEGPENGRKDGPAANKDQKGRLDWVLIGAMIQNVVHHIAKFPTRRTIQRKLTELESLLGEYKMLLANDTVSNRRVAENLSSIVSRSMWEMHLLG